MTRQPSGLVESKFGDRPNCLTSVQYKLTGLSLFDQSQATRGTSSRLIFEKTSTSKSLTNEQPRTTKDFIPN